MSSARTQIEEGLSRGMVRSAWRKLPEEVQSVLSQLITRYPSSRLSASSFLAHPYFSSLLVSTLRFLERDSFAAQSSEAQASFLKGLVGVLPRFSDKVGRRKVLPTLLEETRKAGLVPFLLPNILYIGAKMDAVSTNLLMQGTWYSLVTYSTGIIQSRGPAAAQAVVRHQGTAASRHCAPRQPATVLVQVHSSCLPRGGDAACVSCAG
jgi:hypothetical protein